MLVLELMFRVQILWTLFLSDRVALVVQAVLDYLSEAGSEPQGNLPATASGVWNYKEELLRLETSLTSHFLCL